MKKYFLEENAHFSWKLLIDRLVGKYSWDHNTPIFHIIIYGFYGYRIVAILLKVFPITCFVLCAINFIVYRSKFFLCVAKDLANC